MADIEVQNINIIGVYTTGVELDLSATSQKISKSVYNPNKFAAIIVRAPSMKATGLLFRSGKIVVSGCQNESDLRKSVMMIIKILKHTNPASNIVFKIEEMKIRNITGNFVYPYGKISLENFYFSHAESATYEPELFPGLIYRMLNPPIVYTIYASGKIVINGAKSTEEFGRAVTAIVEELNDNHNFIKRNLINES